MRAGATIEQKIASGFNRKCMDHFEGGADPDEYATKYVVDRVDTTAMVWLGTTLGCAECHDHKYDPFTQKEFYRLFAYFNNAPEKGRAVKFGNSPPFIKAPTREHEKKLAELDARVRAAGKRVEALRGETARAQEQWEKSADAGKLPDWSPARGLAAHWPLDGVGALKAPDGNPAFAAGRLGRAADLARSR